MQREDQKKKYGTDIGATDDQMKEYIENYFSRVPVLCRVGGFSSRATARENFLPHRPAEPKRQACH